MRNHATIEHELAAHDERLARLPRVLALSKGDLVTEARAREVAAEWEERLGEDVPGDRHLERDGGGVGRAGGRAVRRVSPRGAGDEEGGGDSADATMLARVDRTGEDGVEDLAEYMVFRPAAGKGFQIERTGEGAFAVRGRGIERLLQRYDVENEDAMAYLEERLRRIGVLGALEAEGFQPGDELEVAGVTFELDPDAPA